MAIFHATGLNNWIKQLLSKNDWEHQSDTHHRLLHPGNELTDRASIQFGVGEPLELVLNQAPQSEGASSRLCVHRSTGSDHAKILS